MNKGNNHGDLDGLGMGDILNIKNTIVAPQLYQAIISNQSSEITKIIHHVGSNVKYAYDVLINAGLLYTEHSIFYEKLISHPIHAINLSMAFVQMHKNNFSYSNHKGLYQILINKSAQSDQIAKSFALLADSNLPYKNNEALYELLSREYIFSKKIAKAFIQLYKSNLPYKENKKLYHTLIDEPILSEMLADAFVYLSELNIFYKDNKEIYETLIRKKLFIKQAIKLIKQCMSEISPPQEHELLYGLVLVKLIVYHEYYRLQAQNIANVIVHLVYRWTIEEIHLYSCFSKEDYLDDVFFQQVQKNIFIYLIDTNDFDLFVRFTKKNFRKNNEYIIKGLATLKESGISFVENEVLYFALLQDSHTTLNLVNVYLNMKKNGMPYRGHKEIYKFLLTDGTTANLISHAFIKLKKLKIYYHKNTELYDFIGKSISKMRYFSSDHSDAAERSEKIVERVSELMEYVPFCEHVNFYKNLFENEMIYLKVLAVFFKELKQHKISFSNRNDFLMALAKNFNKNFLESIRFILNMNIDFYSYPKYQSIAFLIRNVEIGAQTVKKLISVGYSLDIHQILFMKILEELSSEQLNHIALLSASDFLYDYAIKNTHVLQTNIPIPFLLKQLENIFESYDLLVEGPINKSTATLEIEKAIRKICHDHKSLSFKINKLGHYVLSFSNTYKLNISLLIRNSNLSQLVLDENVLNNLQIILDEIIDIPLDNARDISCILSLLTNIEKKACLIYFGDYAYKNINKLFRGETLSKNTQTLLSTNPQKNLLAYFLIGNIVHSAINKITSLVHGLPVKKILDKLLYYYNIRLTDYVNDKKFDYQLKEIEEKKWLNSEEIAEIILYKDKINLLYPGFYFLDRGEKLSEDAITKRIANVWSFPALTSFSAYKEGISFFHDKKTVRTQLQLGNVSNYYVLNPSEGEVIFSQGEQIKTIRTMEGNLISRIVRSPLFERKNHYLSELALAEAFKKYLSKEYAEEISAINIGHKTIFRPNHDLTNTYRVMLNIEQVIYYFSQYAKEPAFKYFCQNIHPDEIEWLRVAAAFRVTGRESECSAKENLERYERYRAASAINFSLFWSKVNQNVVMDETMLERINHIIRYMGNPRYKISLGSKTAINNIQDAKEREIRNFYYDLLTISHNLDLLRCYSAKQYQKKMQYCLDLSERNKYQKDAFEKMVNYNVELIKIHGSSLNCNLTKTGGFKNTYTPYQKIYAKSSSSIKKLFDRSELVTLPNSKNIFPRF